MSWKRIVGGMAKVSGHPMHDFKLMNIGEEEEEVIYVPESVPTSVPEPAKEPVREPAKEPAKTGAANEPEGKGPAKVPGEAIGYRTGLVVKRDGQFIMNSPIKSMAWERGHATAQCQAMGGHEAPDKDCHCGIFAKWKEEDLADEFHSSDWITQIRAWGRVFRGSKGFRAQHAQIVGIRPPKCENCDEPATHLISANPDAVGGRPSCEEHRPETIKGGKIKVIATPVEDVAKELSDYYGGAEVKMHGESWTNIGDMAEFEDDYSGRSIYGSWASITGTWKRIGWTYPSLKEG